MDTTPEKQAGVPEGAEQVGDASQQQAADGVGGGGTNATHIDTQTEIETNTYSFSVQAFLTHGLTPTLKTLAKAHNSLAQTVHREQQL